jgi:hypothetical protein
MQDPSDPSSSSSEDSSDSSTDQGGGLSYPSDDEDDPGRIRAYLLSTNKKPKKKKKKKKKTKRSQQKRTRSNKHSSVGFGRTTPMEQVKVHGQPNYWTQSSDLGAWNPKEHTKKKVGISHKIKWDGLAETFRY